MSIFRNLLIANSKTSNLINGIFLESIIFDGNSFIDTGIPYQTCTINTKIQFDYKDSRMLHGWGAQAGEYWGSNINNSYELGETTVLSNSDTTQVANIHIEVDASTTTTTLTVNNETISRTGNGSIPSGNYLIGCVNNNYNFYGKIYSHTVRNADGVLIQDLHPCLDPDGIPCFYDRVTGEYFYNQGVGNLSYIGHTKLTYLDTTSIYIDTGVIPTLHTSFELETAIAPRYKNGRDLFGSRNSHDSNGAFGIFANSTYNTFGFYRWGNTIECTLVDTLSHTYYLSNSIAKIDDITYSLPSGTTTNNNIYPLVIGGFNDNGIIYPAPQKVKSCRIWENNILIRYLIPVVRADGMECLFDLVEDKYYERKY